jgi:hypothetical protein
LSMQTKYIYVFDKLQRSLYYNSQGWWSSHILHT